MMPSSDRASGLLTTSGVSQTFLKHREAMSSVFECSFHKQASTLTISIDVGLHYVSEVLIASCCFGLYVRSRWRTRPFTFEFTSLRPITAMGFLLFWITFESRL